jgi:hypothetical protein
MPNVSSTLLMSPLRSKSQRHDNPIAMLPLTAGTKYRARKMWIPRSCRLTTIASTIARPMRIGVTRRYTNECTSASQKVGSSMRCW